MVSDFLKLYEFVNGNMVSGRVVGNGFVFGRFLAFEMFVAFCFADRFVYLWR